MIAESLRPQEGGVLEGSRRGWWIAHAARV